MVLNEISGRVGKVWYQQTFSTTTGSPELYPSSLGGQDPMLVIVLCRFSMPIGKYFFKINQSHLHPYLYRK